MWKTLDGTLVFADVSGFTALSERLARRGRIGAEELTDLLGGCFARLLAVAYADGGGLVKFGGDALLLLFDGPDHAGRACRAAIRIRREMRAIGRLHTSVGTTRLRMSIGVHSGQIHLFRVGGSHLELVVTGPSATETVAMETAATGGEILVSAATARAIDGALVGVAKGDGFLLRDRAVGAPEAGSYPPGPDVSADVSQALPVALRTHLASSEVEPEHRHASVGFVRFEGVDELLERSGPPAVATALDELLLAVQRAVDEQEVTFLTTDIDRDGGKIVLASGVPAVLGDDEGRILRALREIVAGEHQLPVRAGVNRGPLFAGEVGPPYRRTYTVMGDAVNLAARLMAAARPRQLLATAGALERSRTTFEVDALEPLQVKGKAKPVQAFSVGPASKSSTSTVPGRRALPFVGRRQELSLLREMLSETWSGRGGLVEIVGEAGIGKSRLVGELQALADGATVATVRCESYESATPYAAVSALLHQLLGVAANSQPEAVLRRLEAQVADRAPALLRWLPLLAAPVRIDVPATAETDVLDPKSRRERTRQVVTDLLAALLPSRALFVVEDVQWMDEASADLLTFVTHSLPERPWLVAVTRRDESTGFRAPEPARTLSLEPLAPGDAAVLVTAATEDHPLRPHEAEQLVLRAEGNPLFLEELLRAGVAADALPETLEAVVSAQVDRLSAPARRLLRFAAVLGMSFRADLLGTVMGSDGARDLSDAIDELTGYLERRAEGSLLFCHRMVRDVAYEGLSFRRRRELHGHAADAIEQLAGDRAADHAEVLSLHFAAAQRYDAAWRYAVTAGRGAQEKWANVDASDHYERALAAARHLPALPQAEVAEIREALGDVLQLAGFYERASGAYTAARGLLRDPEAIAAVMLKHAHVAQRQGRYSGALGWVRRGLRLVEHVETQTARAQQARLAVEYATVRQLQGRHQDAIAWCRRAADVASAAGERRALARAYRVLDWAYVDLGRLDLATNSASALAIYEELGDLSEQAEVLNNLGGFAYWQGRWADALAFYAESRERKERTGNLVDAALATANEAEILADQGHLDEAELRFRDALRVWQSVGYRRRVAFATMHLGRVASRRGDSDEALAALTKARSEFISLDATAEALETEVWITECLLLRRESREALQSADEGLRREAALGGAGAGTVRSALHRMRGYAFAQLGQTEEAWAALDESLSAARARGAAYELALTLEALSVIAPLAGRPYRPSDDEHRLVLDRLGVTSLPVVPLPVPSDIS